MRDVSTFRLYVLRATYLLRIDGSELQFQRSRLARRAFQPEAYTASVIHER